MNELTDSQLAQIGTRMIADEFADLEREILKLRRLLVRHRCTCRPFSFVRPLELKHHRTDCLYRQEMEEL